MQPQSDNPNALETPSETQQSQLPIQLSPLIERSQEAFRRDLSELLKTKQGQWVAYHADRRVGFGRTKTSLYQECLRQGLHRGEFIVQLIEPEVVGELELPFDV